MQTYMRRTLGAALMAMGLVSMPGCDKFVTVKNPNNLETDSVDPNRDASLLSQSVFTRYMAGSGTSSSLENAYVLGAWFTNHARVGDTFPTRNAVGQRNIPDTGNETDAVWNTIGANIQFARSTIVSITPAGPTLDLARAWWVKGFSILNMAEWFCEGTIAASATEYRPKMSTVALLDSAINDLTQVQTVIAALTGLTTAQQTEANNLTRSAQVGIARAHLQAGRNAQAIAAAAAVPAAFSYSLPHIDNSSQRGLGNKIWEFSEARISLVVGPEFRAIADAGDTRVSYTNQNRLAQDGVLNFYRQQKFPGWGSAMRFASKLEADYIAAEASQDAATIQAFVNTRRAVGGKAALAGLTLTQAMTELMLEKSIDFWLEGHEMRDFRRNPTIYPFVLPTTPAGSASTYYKPSLGPVGSDVCWPVPFTEKDRNKVWNGIP